MSVFTILEINGTPAYMKLSLECVLQKIKHSLLSQFISRLLSTTGDIIESPVLYVCKYVLREYGELNNTLRCKCVQVHYRRQNIANNYYRQYFLLALICHTHTHRYTSKS